MNDRDALLAAILHAPGDDAPRLIYSDWLDEHGESERAEFIRVQIELARLDKEWRSRPGSPNGIDPNGPGATLRRREQELHAGAKFGEWSGFPDDLDFPGSTWNFTRGFVSSISLTALDFLRHAEAIFQRQPVEQVRLFGRHPYEDSGGSFSWYRGQNPNDRHPESDLPKELWDSLDPTPERAENMHGQRFQIYATPELAHAALSSAAVAYGRRLVGLPEMPE